MDIRAVYTQLHRYFGPQGWWPAEYWFEIMVGAVLTQNTAWTNVEQAMRRLRDAGLLDPVRMLEVPPQQLAEAVRPAGYFNVKARRLRALCTALQDDGGHRQWQRMETAALRRRLLQIHGIGEETADCILLYVYRRPVFVIDAYTRRIVARLGLASGAEPYRELAATFERALVPDAQLFNEYHALLVRLGKTACRPKPLCGRCPLAQACPAAQRDAGLAAR